jgi:hypothetical protein
MIPAIAKRHVKKTRKSVGLQSGKYVIYDYNKIQPKLIETYINQIHSSIKLNLTQEENGNINFLDLNIN